MHWDDSPNAGFCPSSVTPWMRVMDDYRTVNATTQMNFKSDAELSPWQWWQRALKDRKEHKDVFVYGDFEDLSADHDKVYAYLRTSSTNPKEKWVVVLNYSGKEETWTLPTGTDVEFWAATTYGRGKAEDKPSTGTITLKPWEGLLGKCKIA